MSIQEKPKASPALLEAAARLRKARADRDAILACLSPLAVMVTQAATSVRDGMSMVGKPDTDDFGQRYLTGSSDALARARVRMAELMDEFGDFFNEGDGCPPLLADMSEASYTAMRAATAGMDYEQYNASAAANADPTESHL